MITCIIYNDIYLSFRTNGKAYFISENGGQDEVNNALSSCLDFLPSIKTESKTAVITQRTFADVDQIVEKVPIIIDKFSGRSVSVQIDYDVSGEMTIHCQFDNSITTITGTDVITFSYQTVSPGSYGISVSSDGRTGRYRVKTLPFVFHLTFITKVYLKGALQCM